MDAVTLQNNINVFENYSKMVKNSPDIQEKVKAGKICLGVKGDSLVVVNYGDSFISSLVESIKHIFNGVRVGEKAEKFVKEVDAVRAKAFFEAQIAKDKAEAAFDATFLGKICKAGRAFDDACAELRDNRVF